MKTQENGTLHIYCTIRQKENTHTHTLFKLHEKQNKENISDRCLRIKTECEKCEMRQMKRKKKSLTNYFQVIFLYKKKSKQKKAKKKN